MVLPIHFAERELAARRKAMADELARRGLDDLLVFRQESMYYLTGYDTFGYVFFQCLYMGTDGETLTLLTRHPRRAPSQAHLHDPGYTGLVRRRRRQSRR
jgi:Xaa-Pro dipeptidase